MYATWLAFTSTVLALARFAIIRSWSGLIDRSAVATMYQVGFDFQAGFVTLWGERVGGDRHLRYGHVVGLGGRNIRLRCHPTIADCFRAFRSREGCFHRRNPTTARTFRIGQRRDNFSGRSWRLASRDPNRIVTGAAGA